ncbi:MAG TPA: hypothetical protein DEG17_18080 [Cyanobacteria bacterium UBA11149]|nr:hypothetical protein [Cyanobacteria bacterium UBA11367]HBE56109.1 hypothetical protein [Cyanobacteria bacterium UBA11366]HBK65844.1 hypothetical protein [Cyanobacteria bacterium UBA11166]HBR75146.1 hypothetical protein [Cyanobacteria bacterium UBA11159]HBS70101.1 hypothetical protein [Cyanobacteria bacterium UBA11153]HBW90727.1 hypothetical protein [Cyanobacteria bacterium UBA11149]HCA93448.1 hypothetical protein [Cyanobacteria bacterium UBA9226]
MSFSKSENKSIHLNSTAANTLSREEVQKFDIENKLAELAIPLAQAWKDNHPEAQPGSEADLDACILAVAIEIAIAGEAVGGPVGSLIASGGGVSAATVACRRVL